MSTKQRRATSVVSGGVFVLAVVSLAVISKGCSDRSTSIAKSTSASGPPSASQVPLNPTTIPMFVTQLPIPHVFAPTVSRNGAGQVIRNEYTITDSETTVQMLPAGFPNTTVLAMGGPVTSGGTFQGSPAPSFENNRGIPTVVHWRTNIQQPAFLPMDIGPPVYDRRDAAVVLEGWRRASLEGPAARDRPPHGEHGGVREPGRQHLHCRLRVRDRVLVADNLTGSVPDDRRRKNVRDRQLGDEHWDRRRIKRHLVTRGRTRRRSARPDGG